MAYLGNDLQVAYQSYQIIDDISSSFNGVLTTFPLQVGGVTPVPFPINPQQCLISVNGVIQEPDPSGTSGFNLVGSNIVFSSAPTGGHAFFGVILAGADYVNVGVNYPSGSELAPSITFDTDLDTGIFNPAPNELGFSTNSTGRLFISSDGKIGIGTSTPSSYSIQADDLVIAPSTSTAGISLVASNSNYLFFSDLDAEGRGVIAYSHGDDSLLFATAASYHLLITSNGDVNIVGAGTAGVNQAVSFNGSAPVDSLVVSSQGNVGIGTANPDSYALANSVVIAKSGFNGATFENSTGSLIVFKSPSVTPIGAIEYNHSPGTFKFYTNSNQRLIITSNGDVNIVGAGTAGVNQAVSFNGSAPVDSLVLDSNGSVNISTNDLTVYGLTVGRGAGAISTNTAVGNNALQANTTGQYNTANGYQALYSNETGIGNTANGSLALYSNETGIYNTANGYRALYSNTAGNYNTANGSLALYFNTTGSYNTANGRRALYFNETGVDNTANGYQALYSNNSGNYNTAIGLQALYSNTTGQYNTANGNQALYSNTTGIYNTANGSGALYSNTTGQYNTATGFFALYPNTTGTDNTANGFLALRNNTIGSYNTANGSYALYSNISGANNTANGYEALRNTTTGSYNTANGYQALRNNITGTDNTANGYQALYSNGTGNYNTAIGREALYNNTNGAGNVCLGSRNSAGSYAPVFNCTTESNRVVMSSTSVTNAYIQVAWTVVSDARDKMNFGVVPHGLEFVKQLNPISFQFKETRDAIKPHGPVRYGFKAQDILALEGEDNAVIIDNENPEKLRYNGEALVPVLVNAIKEQQVVIDAQQVQIDALIARLNAAGI